MNIFSGGVPAVEHKVSIRSLINSGISTSSTSYSCKTIEKRVKLGSNLLGVLSGPLSLDFAAALPV
jgi:hypothetical protein